MYGYCRSVVVGDWDFIIKFHSKTTVLKRVEDTGPEHGHV
jgi:hypothetical protein